MEDSKNRLRHETSPYLQQHASNPVNWYPWGREALETAQKDNKLLFISIGYSACHWCHVMEKESFSNSKIAGVLNKYYISIKIDREERPDLDQTYMSAVQLLTGSGGWPLSCFATPEGKPFYGGSYYSPEQFYEILIQIKDIWVNEKSKIISHSESLCEGIKNSDMIQEKNMNEDLEKPEVFFRKLTAEFDGEYGGLKRVPKFPMPSVWKMLLHYYYYSKDEKSLNQAVKTIHSILDGGLYDQIGGGISRYSTDKYWFIPHFEKMLYDNAQFISLLSDAYLITGDSRYYRSLYQTVDFLDNELDNGEGGFYTSLDADSESEEGKFYVWTQEEISRAAGKNREIAEWLYNITGEGNWEYGKNILYRSGNEDYLNNPFNLDPEVLSIKVKELNQDLLKYRNSRIKPARDEKILTSWNALLVKAFAEAYHATGDEVFKEKAIRSGNYFIENLSQGATIYRTRANKITGFLDDYAYSCEALIMLYQISFDESWLKHVGLYIEKIMEEFYDEYTGMFFYSSESEKNPVSRQHEYTDDVIPSSNSVMAKVLLYASVYFENSHYLKISRQMLLNIQSYIFRSPSFFSNWFDLLTIFHSSFSEIVISGKDFVDRRKEFCGYFLPDVLFAGANRKSDLGLLRGRLDHEDTRIYVCKNRQCLMPVTSIKEALNQLNTGR